MDSDIKLDVVSLFVVINIMELDHDSNLATL